VWARGVNLEIRGNGVVIVYGNDIGVRVTLTNVFGHTDSYIFVMCPVISLYTIFKENNLVAFGVGSHNVWNCAVCVPLVCSVAVYKRVATSKAKNRFLNCHAILSRRDTVDWLMPSRSAI